MASAPQSSLIYLDHAATTPLDPGVLKKMLPFLKGKYGNPSSIYGLGREARAAIELARGELAEILACKPKEIIFTSGGTEANNWAIFGLAEALKGRANHIISTPIEHASVLEPLRQLEHKGFKVTWLKVDKFGMVNPSQVAEAIRPETIFASIIYANNEIGTIQNIAEIGHILHKHGIIFHTDACQAAGSSLEIRPSEINVDLLTINGSKIYGPKGVGALYISEKIKIPPLLFGGGQEYRMRAGTENVAGIVGLAEALKISIAKTKEPARLIKLRDFLTKELLKIPGTSLNGHPTQRLANNINISISGIDAQSLLMRLDMAGIAASSGSACTSGAIEPSHVLQALGLPADLAKNSLRLTLGHSNSQKQLAKAAKTITQIIGELRETA